MFHQKQISSAKFSFTSSGYGQELPKQYVGFQGGEQIFVNHWNDPKKYTQQWWKQMRRRVDWKIDQIIQYQIMSGAGIVNIHGFPNQNSIRRLRYKLWINSPDHYTKKLEQTKEIPDEDFRSHIEGHMKQKGLLQNYGCYYILPIMPGKGQILAPLMSDEKLLRTHNCQRCKQYYEQNGMKVNEDIFLKRIFTYE